MMISKIKKGDTVQVLSGKDKGRKGKVLKVFPREGRIMVEGINMRKKHIRQKKQGQKGQIVQVVVPFAASKASPVCAACKKATRVGFAAEGNTKYRVCKKCGAKL